MFFKRRSHKPFSDDQIGVLFVCMGNICRSPAGEAVFKHYVAQRGQADLIYIDSAGTTRHHKGAAADPRMIEAAAQRGYSIDSKSRPVVQDDLAYFDLILAMDFENQINLKAMTAQPLPHVQLLGCFLSDAGNEEQARSVPDPYYGGLQGFELVLDMIEDACPAIYQQCLTLTHLKNNE